MNTTVEISVVVMIAATMVLFSLLICVIERRDKDRDTSLQPAWAWLMASNSALLVGAVTLILHQLLPFWLSAAVIVSCANLGILFGFFAIHQGLGARPGFRLFVTISALTIALQWALTLSGTGALALFVSTSIANGVVTLGMALVILRLSRSYDRQVRLLVTLPFFVIATGYLLRLALFAIGAPASILIAATALIAATLSYAALQWCFGLISLRSVRLNASLREERLRAQELAEARARFLARMSHEIRTPLNSVIGLADVLQGMLKDKELREIVGHIQHAGDFLIHILNDILDVSKLQANAVTLEERPFDLGVLLHQIAGSHRPKCRERGLTLDMQIMPETAGLWLGDPHRINQILQNVVGNAVKFTEAGGVRVTVSGTDPVLLVVEDTGIGMTEAQVGAMFDEFNQADAGITRRFGGTGLGMSIVHQLVTVMKGKIEVESQPGRGTRFSVQLPLRRPDAAEVPVDQAAPGLASDFGALTVLCADDSKGNLLVLTAMLRQLGVTPQTAPDGHGAIDLATQTAFDLYLLDISMPGFSGIETLQRLRQIEQDQARPAAFAVAATANALPSDIALYLASGFETHLPKPIRLEALRAILVASQERVQNRASQRLEAGRAVV